ncbi:hypothetical protein GCM10012319_26740 [Comamonas sp. KCTC 72670]|nr:hypothetical protein GCM10012319_26740 [Comamonas sp. KCTC 72670]
MVLDGTGQQGLARGNEGARHGLAFDGGKAFAFEVHGDGPAARRYVGEASHRGARKMAHAARAVKASEAMTRHGQHARLTGAVMALASLAKAHTGKREGTVPGREAPVTIPWRTNHPAIPVRQSARWRG